MNFKLTLIDVILLWIGSGLISGIICVLENDGEINWSNAWQIFCYILTGPMTLVIYILVNHISVDDAFGDLEKLLCVFKIHSWRFPYSNGIYLRKCIRCDREEYRRIETKKWLKYNSVNEQIRSIDFEF